MGVILWLCPGQQDPGPGPREGLSYGAERELLSSAKEFQSPGRKEAAFQAGPGRRPWEEGDRLLCRLGDPGRQAPRTQYNGTLVALTFLTGTELLARSAGQELQTLSHPSPPGPQGGQLLASVPAPRSADLELGGWGKGVFCVSWGQSWAGSGAMGELPGFSAPLCPAALAPSLP